jgi:exopolysaccharide production protein ExoZ
VKSDKKILSIQYLRGLAALGVVFCHYGSGLSAYPALAYFFNWGQTGVFVFFFISGFIITYSLTQKAYRPSQFFSFLLRRSVRIDPLYYTVIILTLILFKILSQVPSFKGNEIPFIPAQLISHFLYVVPFTKYTLYDHVFWTLCVEFQFYVLIGLLYFLSTNSWYKNLFLIAFGASCLIPFPNAYYVVFAYAPFFGAGIALLNFNQEKKWFNVVTLIFMLLLIAYKFDFAILALILCCALLVVFFNQKIRPLEFLGDISYSLYLTHGLVFIVLNGCLKRIAPGVFNYPLLLLMLEVFIAIGVAFGSYLLIERPSLRLSKRIGITFRK